VTRYVLAHAARKDLVEILEYIAEDSLDRALEVLDRLCSV